MFFAPLRQPTKPILLSSREIKSVLRPYHTLAFPRDRVFAIAYDKRRNWYAGAIYEAKLELHFARAKALQDLPDQMYTLSMKNGHL